LSPTIFFMFLGFLALAEASIVILLESLPWPLDFLQIAH
jgi:hypothetical protein